MAGDSDIDSIRARVMPRVEVKPGRVGLAIFKLRDFHWNSLETTIYWDGSVYGQVLLVGNWVGLAGEDEESLVLDTPDQDEQPL